jgi:hypothetical protein
MYEQATGDLDKCSFEPFQFDQFCNEQGLHYLTFKIFLDLGVFHTYHLPMQNVINFVNELSFGYSKENPYHNVYHIIDSMQGMSYLLNNGDVSK